MCGWIIYLLYFDSIQLKFHPYYVYTLDKRIILILDLTYLAGELITVCITFLSAWEKHVVVQAERQENESKRKLCLLHTKKLIDHKHRGASDN